MKQTTDQARRFRARLVKLGPPPEVLEKFDLLLEYAADVENEDSLEDLLSDACRIANWTKPWETDGQSLTFRARLIDPKHPEYCYDSGGENTPATEQAYRRGVNHGIATARKIFGLAWDADHPVSREEQKISKWRRARLHDRHSINGGSFSEPNYPCQIRETQRRSGLSLKLRWEVLTRDQRRCVICGVSAKDGVVLEVDHIIPVSKNGPDELENLQTLCCDCNRGKSDS